MKRMPIESLEFRNVGFSYDNETRVFSGLNHAFNNNGPVFLHGGIGSGKNTLMKLLIGLLAPTEGEYLINGINVKDFSHSEFDIYRLNMGFVFEVGGLINNLSLYENFRLLLDYHAFLPEADRKEYIFERLAFLKLKEQMHLRPSALSIHTRKAAAILRAFIMDPEVIIMNDPTLGLNSELIPRVVSLIHEAQKSRGLKQVIICSEDRNLMKALGGKNYRVTTNAILEDENDDIKRAG